MATVEALNEAILAAPDEELPRLAYSDAVATSDVARGEFIKLQIVLAAQPTVRVPRAAIAPPKAGAQKPPRLAPSPYK